MYERSAITVSFIILFVCNIFGQPFPGLKAPTDDFSRAFLTVYDDAPSFFEKIKGKELRTGNSVHLACRKSIPGCRAGIITSGNGGSCIYDFGSFQSLDDAQAAMLKLTTKVTHALSDKVIVRYIDSANEAYLIKRTAIAAIKADGFYGYNILIDVLKNKALPGEYQVQLALLGGEGIFYRFIHKNEPLRSPFFKKSFQNIFTHFNQSSSYSCIEQLPGFTCSPLDSLGKPQLLMEKNVTDLPDARVELECLISSIRAMVGDSFLYYFPPHTTDILEKVVFISFIDHDLDSRRSISAYLKSKPGSSYSLNVVMYHP